MSEIRDKRRRTDLDLFVLALIDGSVSTPYELQKVAGLSQGATVPALQRLLEARFVRQGKPGIRRRTDYKVTAAGRKALKAGWLPLIDAGPSGDIDSDLRVALLAIMGTGNGRVAKEFLRESASKMMEGQATREPTSERSKVAPLARWYCEMRSAAAKALVTAQWSAIRAMADSIPDRLTAKARSRSSLSNKPKSR